MSLDRCNFRMPCIWIFADSLSSIRQLLDSCLKSSLLPAYLAAAFAKNLSRLSLSVPPSGALVIIAIIHNLLRRHPSINCLVHQVTYILFTKCLYIHVIIESSCVLVKDWEHLLAYMHLHLPVTLHLFFISDVLEIREIWKRLADS